LASAALGAAPYQPNETFRRVVAIRDTKIGPAAAVYLGLDAHLIDPDQSWQLL
jgi:hypothetical protein